jgi:hypothetical protein
MLPIKTIAPAMPYAPDRRIFKEGGIAPNDVHERRGPAAADIRFVSELNGWSPSAPRKLAISFKSRV